ncbi:hypothetical protein BDR04DRAFT_1093866, partial [Suillus decipiens]
MMGWFLDIEGEVQVLRCSKTLAVLNLSRVYLVSWSFVRFSFFLNKYKIARQRF